MTDTPSVHSQERIVTIFLRLFTGQKLTKQALADEFQKSPKAIQRDMMQITSAITETNLADEMAIVQQPKGSYALKQVHPTTLTDVQIQTMCQVMLASRALTHTEMTALIAQLVSMAIDSKHVTAPIKSDLVAYHGVPQTSMLDKIALITTAMQKRQILEFTYFRDTQQVTLRRRPTALFFSDLYFWMVTDNDRAYDDMDVAKLSKFRLSLMKQIKVVGYSTDTSQDKHFEAGEFRHKTTLPFFGNPVTLVIDYYSDPQYIVDRFPHTVVAESDDDKPSWAMQVHRITIQANNGYGTKMWLLQQAHMVKIISPLSLRDYVIERMRWALAYYDK
ncbi:helix-turn-helix transcriptional regulator [Lacticaseibacillus daqingensis]|uniref:helix-turn-helix transcriptional regulator n=1 Tax=Lacticaseibacillus daqingensis TaxID=2486014 RepID=UPI000F76A1AD|nr:WYL domain-containing protein [Lacticaseibacillus daqingensis]